MLNSSDLFDESFYLAKYPDIAAGVATGAIASAEDHYFTFGEVEGRDPSAFFDTSYYLQQNPDVAAAVSRFDTTAFEHFLENGQFEARTPTPLFNTDWYRLKNPDVAAAVDADEITGSFVHYVQDGASEGRSASPVFDNGFYLATNPDVAAAVETDDITGIEHFVTYGAREGRNPSPVFDTGFYLATNPDVAIAVSNRVYDSAIEHFLQFGQKEGRASVLRSFLPQPTGPFQVNKTSYQFTDPSRPEIFTPDPNDKRELLVDVWYPGQVPPGTPVPAVFPPLRAPYINPAVGQAIATAAGLPPNFYNLVGTNSDPAAVVSPAQANYPLVIFSHGLGTLPNFYTAELENLASQGYIVAAINHTYVAGLTVFPDGRVAPFASNALPSNPQQLEGALTQTLGVTTADASFVLNQLGNINANDPNGRLTGKMDLSRVGIFGHSFGGLTSTLAMQQDPRFQAGISMDGPVVSGQLVGRPINRPFMLMNAEQTFNDSQFGQLLEQADRQLRPALYNQLTNAGYNLTIPGTEHSNFISDRTLLFPLIATYSPDRFGNVGAYDVGLTDIGNIEGQRVTKIIEDYTAAFFDRHLKNENEPLLAGVSPYTEVEFDSRNIVAGNPNFPATVASAVSQIVSNELGVPTANQRIIEAQQREWPDGCLGLGGPGVLCTQAIVPGWQVRVTNGTEDFVYRTNESGSQVVFETRIPATTALP